MLWWWDLLLPRGEGHIIGLFHLGCRQMLFCLLVIQPITSRQVRIHRQIYCRVEDETLHCLCCRFDPPQGNDCLWNASNFISTVDYSGESNWCTARCFRLTSQLISLAEIKICMLLFPAQFFWYGVKTTTMNMSYSSWGQSWVSVLSWEKKENM